MKRLARILNRRRKPILGYLAAAVSWLGLKLSLDVDPETANWIALAVFGLIVERVRNAE